MEATGGHIMIANIAARIIKAKSIECINIDPKLTAEYSDHLSSFQVKAAKAKLSFDHDRVVMLQSGNGWLK